MLCLNEAFFMTGPIKHRLDKFFDNATEDEKYLFKCYLDPNSVSNVGQATFDKALVVRGNYSQNDIITARIGYDQFVNKGTAGNNAIELLATLLAGRPMWFCLTMETLLLKSPCGFSHKTVNKYYQARYGTDFIEVFQIQLANTYKKEKNYNVKLFLASPKMDGLRCYFKANEYTLKTRNNNKHAGFPDVASVCAELCAKFNLSTIDGELYSHKAKFEALSGLIRSKSAAASAKKSVTFVIFAVIMQEAKRNFNTFDMLIILDRMQEHLTTRGIQHVRIVEYEGINADYNSVLQTTLKFVEKGYEGSMLRNELVSYDYKRSDALLKFKLFKESDFTVVDFVEGKGKYVGTLGCIVVEEGVVHAEVGTGFTDEERDFVWSMRTQLLGTRVEVKYQELTDSGKSLRFPVFSKFK